MESKKRVRVYDKEAYRITVNCTYCEKPLSRKKYGKSKPYCNDICKGKKISEENSKEREILFDRGELKYRKHHRPILLKRYGHVCQDCKNTEWKGQPIPLQVDHIDGNPTNNFPINLRLICHNCDALLPTFAGRNRGNGRKSHGLKAYE